MNVIKAVLWASLTGCVIACAIVVTSDLHETMRSARSAVDNVNGAVTDLRVTSNKLNATLDNVTAATNQFQLAAAEQRQYWQKTSIESAKAMRDLRQLTARLDRSVNDKLIPNFNLEITATAAAAQNALESVQHSADTLTFQLNDPAIAQMADHLNTAAANMASASANVSSGTAHLDRATGDIETAVHRATRPPSLALRVGSLVLSKGAEAAQWVYGYFKK